MAFGRLVFTVLLVSVSCYANNVPVFIWGDQVTPMKTNPLQTTTIQEFAFTVKEVLPEEHLRVVFIEKTLSPEDISSKNIHGASPLSYLAQQAKLGKFSYLSAVDSPVQAIDENVDPTEIDYIKLTEDGVFGEFESSNRKYLFINLNDAKEGESRAEMLERHNTFIQETYEKLQKEYKHVIGFYTALKPSWTFTESHSRSRRQAASNETEDFILEGVRLYVNLIQLRDGDVTHNFTNNPTSSMTVNNDTNTMNTTVNFGDNSFVMNFRSQGGYWFFDSITLVQANETLHPVSQDLYALVGFSYRCGQKTVFTNININTNVTRTLTFNDLQIQPYFQTIDNTVQFGNTFDCVGFFSGAIWAGLMVTFILLAITFYGIMMMMDIRTMDRFDDPKGKTITINASE